MNKQRLAIVIVAGVGVLTTFMPWVKAPIVGTISGTKGDGWVTFALFAVPLVISLLNNTKEELKGFLLYCAILPSLIAAAIGIWKIVEFNSSMSDIGDNPFAKALVATVSIEFGLYLVVLAGVILPIVALLLKDKLVETSKGTS